MSDVAISIGLARGDRSPADRLDGARRRRARRGMGGSLAEPPSPCMDKCRGQCFRESTANRSRPRRQPTSPCTARRDRRHVRWALERRQGHPILFLAEQAGDGAATAAERRLRRGTSACRREATCTRPPHAGRRPPTCRPLRSPPAAGAVYAAARSPASPRRPRPRRARRSRAASAPTSLSTSGLPRWMTVRDAGSARSVARSSAAARAASSVRACSARAMSTCMFHAASAAAASARLLHAAVGGAPPAPGGAGAARCARSGARHGGAVKTRAPRAAPRPRRPRGARHFSRPRRRAARSRGPPDLHAARARFARVRGRGRRRPLLRLHPRLDLDDELEAVVRPRAAAARAPRASRRRRRPRARAQHTRPPLLKSARRHTALERRESCAANARGRSARARCAT